MQEINSEHSKFIENELIFCCWCNQPSKIIWVHGHGQCSICRINIEECCRGENIETETKITKEQKSEKNI